MHAETKSLGSLDILVVDDIASTRRELVERVLRLGHRVVEGRSGEEALAIVQRQAPDLVLLDLLMPGLDGFEVTRRIRALASDRWLPVIVTSSARGDEHFCHALRQGADDYLTRPVNPELLDAKLRHYSQVLQLQRQLGSAVQRQRDIHDNIREAVLTFDETMRVIDANLEACRRFGDGTPVGLVGAGCRAVTGVEPDELLSLAEATLTGPDGRSFPAQLACSQWFDGGRPRVTVIVHDLTGRHAVDRLKGEFLATVSHELRTPLTSLLGAVTLVAAGKAGELTPAAQSLLDMASRNAQRLGRLIDDLLDLTKIESDRMSVHLREVAIGPLLREATEANQGYAQRARVRLACRLDAADEELTLRLDVDRFLQVMANLISNAIKHSPAEGTVTVALEVTDATARIAVQDRGPGIPSDFRQRLFEKFSQADGSDHRVRQGTGLGLYISKLLVERMSGRIEARAADGGGSEFSVTFPRPGRAGDAQRPLLCIVDCDPDAARRARDWVGPRWRVEIRSGLAQDAPMPPGVSLVLADPQGQGDADAFCDGLRRHFAEAPIVLYSDAVDRAYVTGQGLHWIRKSGTRREDLERGLLQLAADGPLEPAR